MAAIFGEGNFFFENCQEYISQIPCGSKISTKSLYLARLRRYMQICVLSFLAKIQNGRHFWGGEIFLKIAKSTFLKRYFVGRKFQLMLHCAHHKGVHSRSSIKGKAVTKMSINEFVEMTMFLCLICFSIYDKMQGFIDKSGLFIYFFVCVFTQ